MKVNKLFQFMILTFFMFLLVGCKIKVEKITLEALETLQVGETLTIEKVISPFNATDQSIIWTSSDNSIATVEDGVVTGIKEGVVTITAQTSNKNVTGTINITIVKRNYTVKFYDDTKLIDTLNRLEEIALTTEDVKSVESKLSSYEDGYFYLWSKSKDSYQEVVLGAINTNTSLYLYKNNGNTIKFSNSCLKDFRLDNLLITDNILSFSVTTNLANYVVLANDSLVKINNDKYDILINEPTSIVIKEIPIIEIVVDNYETIFDGTKPIIEFTLTQFYDELKDEVEVEYYLDKECTEVCEIFNAGTYYVKFTYLGSNFNIVSKVIELSIKKRVPVINETIETTLGTINDTLSKVIIIPCDTSVDGTFVWVDPTLVITSEKSNQVVRFIPEDTTNYETVEVTVTVNAITSENQLANISNDCKNIKEKYQNEFSNIISSDKEFATIDVVTESNIDIRWISSSTVFNIDKEGKVTIIGDKGIHHVELIAYITFNNTYDLVKFSFDVEVK